MKLWISLFSRMTLLLLIAVNLGYFVSNTQQPELIVVTKEVPTAMKSVKAKHIAKELLTPESYRCLMKILHKETTGINPNAKNPDSSARGIGQLLSGTYKNLGMKHSTDEKAQLIATLAYIGRKYGSGGPCAAWDFHKTHNYF
jgi:hypothetical protein